MVSGRAMWAVGALIFGCTACAAEGAGPCADGSGEGEACDALSYDVEGAIDSATAADSAPDIASVAARNKQASDEVPVAEVPAPAARTCGATADGTSPCGPDEYCAFALDAACGQSAPGTCEPRPRICAHGVDLVCGCDGKTHTTPCEAALLGTAVAYEGICADELE